MLGSPASLFSKVTSTTGPIICEIFPMLFDILQFCFVKNKAFTLLIRAQKYSIYLVRHSDFENKLITTFEQSFNTVKEHR